ncbi:MAG: hypothetical protein CMI00_16175 [Oceanospirillaceae bacterium]|nr:hypothetical protein [Oceanospirillaceae bacterium]|tara:strand:+ start:1168 stop:1716 length:549 start_codon:yes stop_codon:yes gene_type:complete
MKYYQPAAAFRRLCDAFDQMPGIGEQGAKRMAEWLMYQSDAQAFLDTLEQAAAMPLCQCCNLVVEDAGHCPLCSDPERDAQTLAVIAETAQLQPLLDSGFPGQVYVLHGVLSPARRIGPSTLRLENFFSRVQQQPPEQLLLALTDTVEGRATADYISRSLPAQRSHSLAFTELLTLPSTESE